LLRPRPLRLARTGDPAAAGLLRRVHREVGREQRRLRLLLVAVEDCVADARADRRGRDRTVAGKRAEQARRDCARVGDSRFRQDHGELVPSQPRDHVCLAQPRAQDGGDFADQLVAAYVTERVVDELVFRARTP